MASNDNYLTTKTTITTVIEKTGRDGRIHRETKTEEKITHHGDEEVDQKTPPSNKWYSKYNDDDFSKHADYDKITDNTNKLSLTSNNQPSLKEFRAELLQLHNQYRQKHGVPNLILSEKLNQTAQEWAEYMSESGRFEHRKNNKYGENIFFGQRRGGMTANDTATLWYGEIKNYNFSSNSNQSCGHFTQMVWKNSKELGIGWIQKDDGATYVVANYDPAGNVMGHYTENVFPPRKN